ncbi:Cysteine-rich secretory protein family protein [Cellulophaga sp. RHA19]|uniref:CAP domain-containing protein n=1 Tax=Cellulophaga sp. RHA19 TaxID=1798237 RepID=UPI000C2CB799|nr:CAP domain-containing protein [Cellulophaga sp. RHA19]PKB42865.1 Cysteine-rich secretory protein family protein [Cellulophaga sp. RHA19]
MLKKIPYLVLIFSFALTSCSKDNLDDELSTKSSAELENELFAQVNKHRESIGKQPLLKSTIAKQYAEKHCIYMATTKDLSHANFEERAKAISEKTGANYISENIANSYKSAQETITSWLQSDGHKANLEGDYTHTGISVMYEQDGDYYYTQLFYK